MTTVARSILNLFRETNERAPNRNKASDGTIGDAAHAARDSDHNPDGRGIVHAGDVTDDPANGCAAHALAESLRLRCKRGDEIARVLTYIISNGRIASRRSNWEWVPYEGPNPHTKHAHLSIDHTAFAENWNGSWWAEEDDVELAELQKELVNADKRAKAREEAMEKRLKAEAEEQGQKTRRVVLDLLESVAKVQGVPPEKVRANLTPETRQILDKVD